MTRRRITAVVLLLGAGVMAGVNGCGTGAATPARAPSAAAGGVLSQMTVSDVSAAYEEFSRQVAESRGHPCTPVDLTDEQVMQLEALEAQLVAGELTPREFNEQANAILGGIFEENQFCGRRVFGSAFGGPLPIHMLDLTDEQAAAAREIFNDLHNDIRALVEDAHQQILALLTDEQLAILEDLTTGLLDTSGSSARAGRGPGFGFPPGRGPDGLGPPGHQPWGKRFAEALDLTEEQQAAIAEIRAELRVAIVARHWIARNMFLALLTDEQLAKLERIENGHQDDDDDDDDDDDGDDD